MNRRIFLKVGEMLATFAAMVAFDPPEGIRTGRLINCLGPASAEGACGFGAGCAGGNDPGKTSGSGKSGSGVDCTGGGESRNPSGSGQCGFGANCAGS